MNLESDIDNLLNSEDMEIAVKKYMLTKNCKKETAYRAAYQRATSDEQRAKVEKAFQNLVASGENLI